MRRVVSFWFLPPYPGKGAAGVHYIGSCDYTGTSVDKRHSCRNRIPVLTCHFTDQAVSVDTINWYVYNTMPNLCTWSPVAWIRPALVLSGITSMCRIVAILYRFNRRDRCICRPLSYWIHSQKRSQLHQVVVGFSDLRKTCAELNGFYGLHSTWCVHGQLRFSEACRIAVVVRSAVRNNQKYRWIWV